MRKMAILIGLVIATFLGFVWQFFPLDDASQRLHSLPLQGEHFRGYNIALTPFESHLFHDTNVLKRTYSVDNQKIFITILDGTHNRHSVHDPYYCFRGSGKTILRKSYIQIPKGKGCLIEMVKEGAKQEALFWFSDGFTRYASPINYWWQTTLRRLTLGFSGKEPILIIIQPTGNNKINWEKILHYFEPLTEL